MKKRTLSLLLALIMCLALLPAGVLADSPQIYDVYQGDGFYITATPYKLNSTKYQLGGGYDDELYRTFYDGYLFVTAADVDENYVNHRLVYECNLADKNGNIVLPAGSMYNTPSVHYAPSEGLVAFWDGKTRRDNGDALMGFMDYQGNVVIPCQYRYDDMQPFHDGLTEVHYWDENGNPLRKTIDKTGRTAFEGQERFRSDKPGAIGWVTTSTLISEADSFNNGLMPATRIDGITGTKTYGYINKQGEMVLTLVTVKEGSMGYMDTNYWKACVEGRIDGYLMPIGNISTFSDDGYALVYDLRSGDRLAYAYAIIDTSGNVVATFRDMLPLGDGFHDGMMRVSFMDNRNEQYDAGYIDTSGNVVWRSSEKNDLYIAGRDYSCGVATLNGCVVDKKGNAVIPDGHFHSMNGFHDNLCLGFTGEGSGKPYVLEIHQGVYTGSGRVYGAAPSTQQPQATGQPSSWAQADVTAAVDAGLVPETLRGNYTQATTRAEFCALAVALYETVKGTEVEGRTSFTDTNDVNVEKAAYLGVVNGVGNGQFDPGGTLTREQAATMLSRLAIAINRPLAFQEPAFADNANISSWAYAAVGQMKNSGVMGGVGNNNFAPKGDYSREQSIVTIKRLQVKLFKQPKGLAVCE